LGGTILELTVPPILYITIIGSWIYITLCVHSYFLTLRYEKRPPKDEDSSEEANTEVSHPLVIDLREVTTQKKVFPRNIWDDGTSVSNFSQKSLPILESPSNTVASTRV